jgi:hypothetical protein
MMRIEIASNETLFIRCGNDSVNVEFQADEDGYKSICVGLTAQHPDDSEQDFQVDLDLGETGYARLWDCEIRDNDFSFFEGRVNNYYRNVFEKAEGE